MPQKKMGFVEAAKQVLADAGRPLTYREITKKAQESKLLESRGQTPEISMHVMLSQHIKKARAAGETPDLVKTGRGEFYLLQVGEPKIEEATGVARRRFQQEALKRLRALGADKLHELIAELMVEMGHSDVEIVDGKGDKKIDIIGTMSLGQAQIKVGVQAKAHSAYKRKVSDDVVRSVRDALKVHGCTMGWVVTTTTFVKEAVDAAQEMPGSNPPMVLIAGENLVEMLIEYRVGVETQSFEAYLFDPDGPLGEG